MKVIGYIPLYYGAEYLGACVQSMLPHVDKLIIVYVSKPSQGYDPNIPCPETEKMLMATLHLALEGHDGAKVEWHSCAFGNESEHRNYILSHSKEYDLVLTADADEVLGDDVQQALEFAYNGKSRRYGIDGFINFWRSFNHVCIDGFRPVRIMNLNNAEGEETVKMTIFHFGCCQQEDIMRFKWLTSGHKNELRENWLDEVYYAWTPENNLQNLHCVANGIWNAVEFDKTTLPDILKSHPNYNKEVV